LFVVTQFGKSTTVSVSSISDGTNNYTLAKSAGWDPTNFDNQELWYCANSAPLAPGATITITYSAPTIGGTNQPVACAGYCMGLTATPLDKTNSTKYEPGTAYSSGTTGTLTQAKELIIGALGFYNANCTITEGSALRRSSTNNRAREIYSAAICPIRSSTPRRPSTISRRFQPQTLAEVSSRHSRARK